MDRRAWQATVHGLTEESTRLSDQTTATQCHMHFTKCRICHLKFKLHLKIHIPFKYMHIYTHMQAHTFI